MKLLIAEDEPLCLKDLKSLDWHSLGIETVLTADNGETAYEIALSQKPNIILSDIKMPKISGLELAKKLSVNLPESRFIILTAYNRFDYAQSAIASGVCSYILKPYTDEDVMNAVSDAMVAVREEQRKNSYNSTVTKQLEVSKHFLMNYFFNTVSDKSGDKNELYDIFGSFEADSVCTAMIISLDYSNEADSFKDNFKIFNHLIRIFESRNISVLPFFNTTQLIYFFLSEPVATPAKAQNSVLMCANAAESYLNFNYPEKYVIGVGNSIEGTCNCELSYNSALDAIKHSFYLGYNCIICISDLEAPEALSDYQYFFDDEFFGYVKAGDSQNTSSMIKELFNSFRSRQAPVETVQRICHEILVHLSLCLLQRGHNPDLIFNKTNVWNVLQQYSSLNALEEFVTNIVDVVISAIAFHNSQKNQGLIDKVKAYITSNLDTSLNEIAEHFAHSPNYISNVFSKEAGVTIKNYMISERVERAKELLATTDKSIGAIAAEVGYKNLPHFSTVFSKHAGVTPSIYRSSLINKD